MYNKLLYTAGLALVTLLAVAQPQPVGHLTIFSEDGDKFYLILNGERQNNVAQTNLRVEDLTQNYYTAKIIFEDSTLGDLNKNYLAIADADGVKQDVTYKIKKNKNNGKITLNYFSMVPVNANYTAPANVYVMHYGQPQQVAPVPATTTTRTTTTTTTGTPNTVATNVNVGGVNMNVTITDPLLDTRVTHTTTTQTTTTQTNVHDHAHHDHPHPHTPPPTTRPVGCPGAYAMNAANFSSALETVRNQSFDETRLKTAKQIAASNCLNASQVAQICQVFGFESSKLDFAKYAYSRCTEPSNYFKINNVFGFSSSVDELNDYISGGQ